MLYLGGDDYHPLQHTSYENMTMQEISEALHIAVSNISRRLESARKALRRQMEGGMKA